MPIIPKNTGSSGSLDLEQVLTNGNSTGAIPIVSPDGLSRVFIDNDQVVLSTNHSSEYISLESATGAMSARAESVDILSHSFINMNGNLTSTSLDGSSKIEVLDSNIFNVWGENGFALSGPFFTGSGLNDLSVNTPYLGSSPATFTLVIDSVNTIAMGWNSLAGTPTAGMTFTQINGAGTGTTGTFLGFDGSGRMLITSIVPGPGGTFGTSGETVTFLGGSFTTNITTAPFDTFSCAELGLTYQQIQGGIQLLGSDVNISFASATGHTIPNQWVFSFDASVGRVFASDGTSQVTGDVDRITEQQLTTTISSNKGAFTLDDPNYSYIDFNKGGATFSLRNTLGQLRADIQLGQLINDNTTVSFDWNNALWNDFFGTLSIDGGNRTLNDGSGSPFLYYGTQLSDKQILGHYSAGSSVAEILTFGSGIDVDASTGVITATGSGGTVTSVASADGSITVTNPTSTVDLAVVKAPIWSTARLLAGNSVNGSANVAFANKFIVQGTTDAGLSGAQFLGALATGLVKNTTTTGVLSIATAGTDYVTDSSTNTFTNKSGNISQWTNDSGYLTSLSGAVLTTRTLTINGSTQDLSANRIWTITTTGTANRISVSGGIGLTPTIDISASYVGQTSITTLGTITTGDWRASVVGANYGGTGVANAGTITNASNTTITGGGTLALGGFTLTVPATGTALLGNPGASGRIMVATSSTNADGNSALTYSSTLLHNSVTQNSATQIKVTNSNVSAIAEADLTASNGSINTTLRTLSSGWTTAGQDFANGAQLVTNTSVGFSFQSLTASTYWQWLIGGNAFTNQYMRLDPTDGLTVGNAGGITGKMTFAGATSGGTVLIGTATGAGTLTLPAITGTLTTSAGANTRIAFYTGTNAINSSANFLFSAGVMTINPSTVGSNNILVSNANTGGTSTAMFTASNNTVNAMFKMYGNTYTTAGLLQANLASIEATSTVGLLYNIGSGGTYWFNIAGTTTTETKMSLTTDSLSLFTRLNQQQGADIASANNLTLGSGNSFEITGTTQINAITTANWTLGARVTLLFTSTPTVKHNTAGGGGTAVILLAGAADFAATAGDTLSLIYSEIGGTNAWREIGRAVI